MPAAATDKIVNVQQHRTLRRSDRLAYLGYAAPIRLPQSAALLHVYGLGDDLGDG